MPPPVMQLLQAAMRPEFRKGRCVVHKACRSVSFRGGEGFVPADWPGESSHPVSGDDPERRLSFQAANRISPWRKVM